jgi:tetratricopeptide (TPR) repeat protein
MALREVDKVIGENPNFIRAISMKGAILYSQQKLDESLAMYEKALALDKQFDEAVRMIDVIKKKKGGPSK